MRFSSEQSSFWETGMNLIDLLHIIFHPFSNASGVALWMALSVSWLIHQFHPHWHRSVTMKWIAIKLGTDIRGAQRMNPNDSGSALTFIQRCHKVKFSLLAWILPKFQWVIVPRWWILMTFVIPWLLPRGDICSFYWSASSTIGWIAMTFGSFMFTTGWNWFSLWLNTCKYNDMVSLSCTVFSAN